MWKIRLLHIYKTIQYIKSTPGAYVISRFSRHWGLSERRAPRHARPFRSQAARRERVKDDGDDSLPIPKPRPVRPPLVSKRTKQVMNRLVSANPTLTARELKTNKYGKPDERLLPVRYLVNRGPADEEERTDRQTDRMTDWLTDTQTDWLTHRRTRINCKLLLPQVAE